MMDLSPINLPAMRCIEAVALREPAFNRPFFAQARFGRSPVLSTKLPSATKTTRFVMNIPANFPRRHCRMKIGQVVERTRRPDRRKIACIEAEKIHSRLAAVGYISAYVQLRKTGEAGQRRKSASANAAHMKWDHSRPALPIESIERKLCRNERPHRSLRHRPVRKEQIVPSLRHHPRPGRQRPRTMRDYFENRMHPTF